MNDGGPAFPSFHITEAPDGFSNTQSSGGLTIRDWFAGQAMAPAWNIVALVNQLQENPLATPSHSEVATVAYKMADAMLAEREKNDGQ